MFILDILIMLLHVDAFYAHVTVTIHWIVIHAGMFTAMKHSFMLISICVASGVIWTQLSPWALLVFYLFTLPQSLTIIFWGINGSHRSPKWPIFTLL